MKNTPASASDCEPPAAPEPAQPTDATLVQQTDATLVQRTDATIVQRTDATIVAKATSDTTPAQPAESVVPPVALPAASPVAQKAAAPVRRTTHLRAIAVAAAAILVVAALALPRRPAAPNTDADAAADAKTEPPTQAIGLVGQSPQPSAFRAEPIEVSVTASAAVAPETVSAPSKKTLVPKPAKNRTAASTKSAAPVAAMTPVADIPFEDATAKLPGSEATTLPSPPSFSASAGGMAPVTITGCLEISVNHDEYRLTDTEGIDAPRSRSWRSGFLKKRSAPVALVDVPDRLALQSHVGRRVAATGLLTSRDLKVSALRVVGSPCN